MIERFEQLPTAKFLHDLCRLSLKSANDFDKRGKRLRPIVVIDTNVLLDIFFWKDSNALFLSDLLKQQRIDVVHTQETIFELADVLSRDHFGLTEQEQRGILQTWNNLSKCVEITTLSQAKCKDSDDQKFLDLCVTMDADFLITKDKLLKKAAKRLKTCTVIDPQQLSNYIDN